jgi:YD repeat-containing protein
MAVVLACWLGILALSTPASASSDGPLEKPVEPPTFTGSSAEPTSAEPEKAGGRSLASGSESAAPSEIPPPTSPTLSLTSSPFPASTLPSPEQANLDASSRLAYAGLGRGPAIALAERSFHIETPSWTAPGSETGSRIAQYLSPHSAREERPNGREALVQSTLPLQVEKTSGTMTPVSTTLHLENGAYVPASPLVPLSISKDVTTGASFLSSGISVAPTSGAAEEPVVVGNRVMWANTETDTDFISEPMPGGIGIEDSWQLRSQNSPQEEALVFSLSPGASLQMSATVPGAAEVSIEGRPLLFIPPASAVGAAGEAIPVTYAVKNATLTLHVALGDDVDYPVMVDPEVIGYYGEAGGDNQWQHWYSYSTCGGCFGFPAYDNLLQLGAEYTVPSGNWGEWYTGVASSSSARITRVDVTGVTHQIENQSTFNMGIGETNGSDEIYSENGYGGASGPAPFATDRAFSGQPLAFCADSGGGHDGGEPPLCNEAYGGTTFYFADDLLETRNEYNWASISSATVRYIQSTPPTLANETQILDAWTKSYSPYVKVKGEDSGLGIAAVGLDAVAGEVPLADMPSPGSSPAPGTKAYDPTCEDPFCPTSAWDGYTVSELGTGVWTLGAWTRDAVGLTDEQTYTAYIDKTPPTIETPSWSGATLGDGAHVLTVSAKDGSTKAPQSGVRLIHVYVDGVYVSNDLQEKSCEPTPTHMILEEHCYGLTGSWTLQGEDYGAGPHTITIWAEDWAGNTAEHSFHITVAHPVGNTQQVGPGTLNLRSGDYTLSATDTSVPAGTGTLSVGRTYNSQSKEPAGPLGPGWLLALPDTTGGGQWQSLQVLSEGKVEVTTTNGQKVLFVPNGEEGYTSPTGFQDYYLSEISKSPATYRIINPGGDYTQFTEPTGATAFMPTTVGQAVEKGGLNKVTYVITEGKTNEIVGPEPSNEECTNTPATEWAKERKTEEEHQGCRVLSLKYDTTETTAKGEAPTEWGNVKGQLESVAFTAWNTKENKLATVIVARYEYDKQDRLRAEWDPRIEPALKTVYGYDGEDHVTAITPPGQESWALTYGKIASDASTGRLLKVTQAPASNECKSGCSITTPQNTELPKLSGSPTVGKRMALSNGVWSNAPIAYGYQWEDCNSAGKECTPILGATNANYTPATGDVGHTLIGRVTATNGGGAIVTASVASSVVSAIPGGYTQKVDSGNSLNAVSCVTGTTDCVLSDNDGKAFYATNVSSSSPASWSSWRGPGEEESPSQAVECPTSSLCLLAGGKEETAGGDLYYATALGGSWKDAYNPSYGVDAISCASSSFCITGQDGDGYFRYATNPASTSWTLEDQGSTSMRGAFCLSSSFCALADGTGHVHIATTTSQIESSSWKETDVDGTTKLDGISCTSTTSCIAIDSSGNVVNLVVEASGGATATKHDIDGTNSLAAITCTASSTCVTVDSAGNVFVSKNNGETWTKLYSLGDKLTSVACASASLCAAADTTGNLTTFNPGATTTEGEVRPPQPGWTIEYNSSLTGEDLPAMSKATVEQWGEKDNPVEATAIFPPDEQEGWPAGNFRRATVSYFDATGRLVNVVTPGEAVSTTQYEAYSNPEWTLTPENRKMALEAGSESAKKAELLATKSTYTNEGTELVSRLGPQHEVKLASGGYAQARALTKYYYDEGAPSEGGPYGLVTKTVEGAQLESGKEEEMRTVKYAYSGQSNLGWEIHKPTSISVEPESGKVLTRTTEYSPETGDVINTKAPSGNASATEYPPVFSADFGKAGSGNGELKEPKSVAVTKNGNVLVLDTGNGRLEEFTPAGTYAAQVGSTGTGIGQMKGPVGMTVDAKGNIWIADTGNNRVDEFNEKREFVKAFGFGVSNGEAKLEVCTTTCEAGIAGAGTGEFKEPKGIAVNSSGDLYVSDTGNDRLDEFTEKGEVVAILGFGVSNEKAEYEICTSGCKAGLAGTGHGQFNEPLGLATTAANGVWVADRANNRLEQINSKNEYASQFGTKGTGVGQLKEPADVAVDATGDVWVSDTQNNRVQRFTATGEAISTVGSVGSGNREFQEPLGIALTTTGTIYVADLKNNRIDVWVPQNLGVHETHAIYYTAGVNHLEAACGLHPEWVNLPCQTKTAAEPQSDGLPGLPENTTTYNMWDETETATEKSGTATRTTTETHDAAGRLKESIVVSSTGKAEPSVTNTYSPTTGALVTQSTTSEGKTKEIKKTYNTREQLVSYTDAAGVTSTAEYNEDGEVTKSSDGKGSQTAEYNTTTGTLTTLDDSGAGTFTATYNIEDQLVSETYPNGMTLTYTRNPVGQTTALTYTKNSATWYKDTEAFSIHGQALAQQSTLASDGYQYDKLGRVTQAEEEATSKIQEEAVGKGCVTDLFAYDADSNRIGETKREPGAGGACSAEGGTTTYHDYDEADRLTDAGVEYEPFGESSVIPAADAGGQTLESSYYAGGALYSQTQNGQTDTFALDPAGRVLEDTTVKGTNSTTTISNYASSGSAPSWTETSGSWTRNISGISGKLVATQTNGGEATIYLANLHGDVVGTTSDNGATEAATLKSEPTAFGVPTSTPEKNGWLGTAGLQTEFKETGIIGGGGGVYIPQVGLHLEAHGLSGAAAQDPVNEYAANQPLASPRQEGPGAGAFPAPPSPVTPIMVPPPLVEPPANEGGNEEITGLFDPEGIASYHQTKQRAFELTVDGSACGNFTLTADIEGIPCEDYEGALAAASINLEECAGNKPKHPYGVCYINETRKEIWPTGESIPWSAEAELCTYVRTVLGKNHYYCPGRQEEVWGPWFHP